MKDQLFNIYSQRHIELIALLEKYPEANLSGPLLISPNDIYETQPYPLLIIGKETRGWENQVQDISMQMNVYKNFNVGEKYKSTPFWNVTRKIEKALGNKPFSCAWTNISKVDSNGLGAKGVYQEAISTLDNLLIEEIKILKPKVCIFFTGPGFKNKIDKIFRGIKFEEVEGFETSYMFKLSHDNLPNLSYTTYHPRYLRTQHLEDNFINLIYKSVK